LNEFGNSEFWVKLNKMLGIDPNAVNAEWRAVIGQSTTIMPRGGPGTFPASGNRFPVNAPTVIPNKGGDNDDFKEESHAWANAIDELTRKIEAYDDAAVAAQQATNFLAHSFEDFTLSVIDGSISAKDALKGLLDMLMKALMQSMLFGSGPFARLMGTASASGGPGGLFGSIGSSMRLPGFASGGSFTVGGKGGTDSQMVAFRASPGEPVKVGSGAGGRAGTQKVIVNNYAAVPVRTNQKQSGADQETEIFIGSMNKAILEGRADGSFRGRFGARPALRSR
ncbi:MAG: hypothetical protein MN733_10245, partial [Nitrososphaera sp.]|nr:hypothetical protein [Nitrososphaera sp.]